MKIWYHVDLLSWNVNRIVSDGIIMTFSNAIIHILGICSSSDNDHAAATASSLAMTSFGIPLTGSISAGIYHWIYEEITGLFVEFILWLFDNSIL